MSSLLERSSAGGDAPGAVAEAADGRLDFLTALPPEMAVHILRFLPGKELCCVVLVSKAWSSLAQVVPLRARRLKYVKEMKEKYLQSKEDFCPLSRQLPLPRTPRSSIHRPTTGCPLQSISTNRLHLIRATSSNHIRAHPNHNGSSWSATRMMPYPTDMPLVPRLSLTPENANVSGQENDDLSTIRRRLFPLASPRYPRLDRAIRRDPATEQDAFTRNDTELDMSKKAVRKRMKRL